MWRGQSADERGEQRSSAQLAKSLQSWSLSGKTLVFLIGGPDGWDAEFLARCDARISLSAMTFTHGMARLLLVEQLYRAQCILDGHPYHRA
jgi:23S rRNA (pseudouridine1915-N3)-methyltransferase